VSTVCNSSKSVAGINGGHSTSINEGWRLVLLSAALVSLVSYARANPDPNQPISRYIHQVWQDDQGLPQNNVLAITRTRDGYLWLGTEEGLARFDGARFVVFDQRNSPGLRNDSVTTLLEDREGNLWIGTLGGLFRMTRGVIAAYPEPQGLSGKYVTSLYLDRQGALWVATDGGGVGRLLNGQFTAYNAQNGLASNTVFAMSGDADGSVWLGTHGGLNRWKEGKLASYTTQDGLPNDDIRALCAARKGGIWIGTRKGLGLFRNGTFSRFDKGSELSVDIIRALYEDRNQALWIGTLSGVGLIRLKDGKVDGYSEKDGLSGTDVVSILGDETGNLWVGTSTGGLNRFSQGNVETYTTNDGLPGNVILATFQDRKDDMWIGTSDRGLSRFHDGKFTNYSTDQGLSSNTIFSVTEDFDHNLWIGTRKGLNRFKDGRFRSYTTRDGLAGDTIVATLVDRNGTLWAGGRDGLSQFKNGRFIAYRAEEGKSSLLVTSIAEDGEGGLWVGTDAGLRRFTDGRLESPMPKSNNLTNDYVLSLYKDPQGSLWIGTNGAGLSRLRNGKFTAYNTAQGLFDDMVLQFLDPGDGNLWMSSDRGIFYVKKQQLDDFADGKISTFNSVVFGTDDGMKSKECNGGFQPAGWITREGRLVFPTMKGIAIIDPKHLKTDVTLPSSVIESVTVDSRRVPLDAPFVSPPGRGDLEFQFTAPSFVSPQKIRFQYQLEGYDRDFVEAIGSRVAHYTNIPAGKYRFRVRAGDEHGHWSDAVAFSLVLKPHFYRTYWFYVLCSLIVLALGVAVLRVRLMRLKVRQQELSLLIDQRTAELQNEILMRKRTEEYLEEARDEAIRARDELHFQANHDSLTGLWNRGAILDQLNRELERSARSHTTTGLLMIDVDHFKKINDTHGHPVGDVVLKQVVRRISQVVRAYDSVGRYGGEEFLVVLPGCDNSQTLESAERIRLGICEQTVWADGVEMVVTISIGATVLLPDAESAIEVLSIVDSALYLAKDRGRNQTAFGMPRAPAGASAGTKPGSPQ